MEQKFKNQCYRNKFMEEVYLKWLIKRLDLSCRVSINRLANGFIQPK